MRTYVLYASGHQDTLSPERLAEAYDMPVGKVRAMLCKMIHNKQLNGYLCPRSMLVKLESTGESRTQALLGAHLEKVIATLDALAAPPVKPAKRVSTKPKS